MASYLAAAGAGVAVSTGALVLTSSGPAGGCGGVAGGGSSQAESVAAASRREARGAASEIGLRMARGA